MKFACPQCATGYELPDSALPKPRDGGSLNRMRCIRCRCVFLLSVSIVDASEVADADPQSTVYFDFVSPDALPGVTFLGGGGALEDGEGIRSTEKRIPVKYEVHPVSSAALYDESSPISRNTATWDSGGTLDLSDFELKRFARTARIRGIVVGMPLVLTLVFLVYVAAMNQWTIGVNTFSAHVRRAFFLQSPEEVQQDLLSKLEVRLERGYTVRTGDRKRIGVVTGEVQNNGSVHLVEVVLEGRVLNLAGEQVMTQRIPCGVMIPDARIRKMKATDLHAVYGPFDGLLDCQIRSGFSERFKWIIPDLPADYTPQWSFQLHPIAAESQEFAEP